MNNPTKEAYAELEKEIASRQFFDELFNLDFFHIEGAPETPQDFDCYRMLIGGVEEMCGSWTSYSLKFTSKLAAVCDTKTAEEISDAYVKIGQFCGAI